MPQADVDPAQHHDRRTERAEGPRAAPGTSNAVRDRERIYMYPRRAGEPNRRVDRGAALREEVTVSSIQVAVVAAVLVLAGAAREPLADPFASVPGPVAVAATDTLTPATAGEPLQATRSRRECAPTAETLSLLRTSVGRRIVRVSVDQDVYELTRARFDSSGVSFTPGGEEGMPLWPGEDAMPVASPITWDRIGCIRAQHSYAMASAIAGAAVAVAPIFIAVSHEHGRSVEANIGWAVVTPLAAALGALVGGNFGAAGTWPIAWQRPQAGHGTR